MPKKVPLISIGVKRGDDTVYPEIGKPFDFTKEEIADIEKMAKAAKTSYFRDTVNEDGDDDSDDDLNAKTKAQLLEVAKEKGVEVAANASKADIIAAIEAAEVL